MTTLRQVLDQTLELLQYEGKYKSFGALQKAKYQNSKPEEDKEIRSIMYEGQYIDPEAVKKANVSRKNNPKLKEINKKAAKTRSEWYKDPDNYAKFKESLKKRKNNKKN